MLKYKLLIIFANIRNSNLIKNSFWGIAANLLQNIFYSVFFIVIARKYSTEEFSSYILANSIYAFIVAFSSMGLGQWFIRELIVTNKKNELIAQFFKIQFITGVLFYCINIVLIFTIYDTVLVRNLSMFIGINIIFDNIIYVITFNNIAQQEQKKNFIVLTIEALLKFLSACLLYFIDLPIVYLSIVLIAIRLTTLSIFIRMGVSYISGLVSIISVKLNWATFFNILKENWAFIVIGSSSVIYWRIGILLVSKNLPITDVAIYEISYKFFAIAQVLPFIVSTSIFPKFIKTLQAGLYDIKVLYKKAFIGYTIYGLFVYSFVFTFSDALIPYLFGIKYFTTPLYCKEMFLTILIFPTVLLQANLLVAMKLEKIDMKLNLVSLIIHLFISSIGLFYYKSLSVINYSIFISFIAFHFLQDVILYRLKIVSFLHIFLFYLSCFIYLPLNYLINSLYLFCFGFHYLLYPCI
jgi:O-antigen/teichoic acid export membrane protein